MQFEWDEGKNRTNICKHGIDFNDVSEIFTSLRVTKTDSRKDQGEIRRITVGKIDDCTCVVVYTKRDDVIRAISARKANPRERRKHDELIKGAANEEA